MMLYAVRHKKTGKWLNYVGGLSMWDWDLRYGVFWADKIRKEVWESIFNNFSQDIELVTLTVNPYEGSLE